MHNIILMNAVPFHKGHEYAIRFMLEKAAINGECSTIFLTYHPDHNNMTEFERKAEYVLGIFENSRDAGYRKAEVISLNLSIFNKAEPDSDDDKEYWETLSGAIRYYTKENTFRVFASEYYGETVAKWLGNGSEFVPVDINRTVVPVSGTQIRNNLYENFKYIPNKIGQFYKKTAVIFGAESVGKTTLAKKLAEDFGWTRVDEWARPYLEGKEDKTITPKVMETIFEYQQISENLARSQGESPVIVKDTDLVSTYGYYKIANLDVPNWIEAAVKRYVKIQKPIYFVLGQKYMPFTPDPLRYGGDKRESTDEFWLELLKELGVPENDIVYLESAQDYHTPLKIEKRMREEVNSQFDNYSRPK